MEVNRGYKQTEVGVIPEDWDVIKLGDIGECLIGLTYSPSNVKTDGTLVLRSSNVQNGSLSFNDNVYVDAEIPQRIRVINGDILVCVRNGSRALIGKSALLDKRVEGQTFGAFMSVYRTKDFGYIFQQFQSDLIKRQINENIGATINQITNRNLNSFKVPFPTDNLERKAITGALSDLDALLATQERLLIKKRDIKQAVMQQLLSGKKRLQGFTDEWEVRYLGDIAVVLKGRGLSKDKVSRSGIKKCVLYGELFTTYSRVIADVVSSTDSCEGTLSINGDVLLPGSTTTTGIDLATASVLLCNNVLLGGDINIVRAKGDFYSSTFLAYLLTEEMKHKIAEMAQGTTIIHLYGKSLLNLELCLPTIKEQIAITNILSDMDAELNALEEHHKKILAIKQGMMQELLTGKIRLK
jgi:type I restriction enzyme S subunit